MPIPLIVAFVIALVAGAIAYVADRHEDREVARLEAITTTKAGQIADWLQEKKADVQLLQRDASLIDNFRRWRDQADGSAAPDDRIAIQII